jgi:hypothetical protein
MDHKPTDAQRRLLGALAASPKGSAYRDLSYDATGLRGGAFQQVYAACQRRGWIDAQGRITEAGEAVARGAA